MQELHKQCNTIEISETKDAHELHEERVCHLKHLQEREHFSCIFPVLIKMELPHDSSCLF